MQAVYDKGAYYDTLDMNLNQTLNLVAENMTYAEMIAAEDAVPQTCVGGRLAYCTAGAKAGKFAYGGLSGVGGKPYKWIWLGEVTSVTGIYKPDEVICATTGSNITLNGYQTIDGVSMTSGRVLVKDQTLKKQNGVYEVSSGNWTRAWDTNTWDALISAMVVVSEGATNADTQWMCTIDRVGTLETDPVNWLKIPLVNELIPRIGLSKNSNYIDVDVDTVRHTTEINASDQVAVKINPAGAIGTGTGSLGTGTDTLGLRVRPDNITIGINANNELETKWSLKFYRQNMAHNTITSINTAGIISGVIQNQVEITIPHNMGLVPYSIQFRHHPEGFLYNDSVYPNITEITNTYVKVKFSVRSTAYNTATTPVSALGAIKIEVFMIGGNYVG